MSNFWDLINVEELWEKRDYFSEERWEISYYCKDCSKLVETSRKSPKWFIFECKECNGKNVALGTLESLKTNYKIKDINVPNKK